jgi:hypothetical protein
MTPAILDVEASGFGRGSYPIEVGFVLPDGRSHCVLIRPEAEWQDWDFDAERLHGLSRAQLQTKGRSVFEVAQFLNDHLSGLTVYSDAWGNDQSWLALLYECAGLPIRFRLDTLRALLSEAQLQLWSTIKQEVERELDLGRHRASNDARVLQLAYQRTLSAVGGDRARRERV